MIFDLAFDFFLIACTVLASFEIMFHTFKTLVNFQLRAI